MATDPTEDAIRKEIADAVKILRDDGVHIHRTYSKFQKSLTGDPDPNAEPPEGGPPPAKDPKPEPPKVAKKGLWWGDRSDD